MYFYKNKQMIMYFHNRFIILLTTIQLAILKFCISDKSVPIYLNNSTKHEIEAINVSKNLVQDYEIQENCSGKAYFSSSRKRRYLVFPNGASFQIVWDGIIAVVDYTNYLILGLTVALAWELPSKIPTELYSNLQNEVETMVSGKINHNDAKNKYEYGRNTSITYAMDDMLENLTNKLNSQTPYVQNQLNWSKYTALSTRNDQLKHAKIDSKGTEELDNKNSFQFPPLVNRNIPMSLDLLNSNKLFIGGKSFLAPKGRSLLVGKNKSQISNYKKTRQDARSGKRKLIKTQRPSIIYPVFGKRTMLNEVKNQRKKRSGINYNNISAIDRIHIQYQRSSRQQLYKKLEKYFDKRSSHGRHCVLRTLCETSNKSNKRHPSSFIGELIRAVFTLPEALEDETVQHYLQRFDLATSFKGNCRTRYQHCKESLWSTDLYI